MRRLLSLLLLAAVALPACGEDEPQTVPVRDLIAAAKQTRGAKSQRVALKMEMSGGGLPGPVGATGDAVINNRTGRGRMTMDMTELDPAAGKVEQIIHGTTFYMRYPTMSKQLGTDKDWLEFDMQELGKKQGFDFNAIMPTGSDPTAQLDQLKAASGDPEVIGNETVRGVETTRYRAAIDLRRYPDTLPPDKREAARRSMDRVIELTGSAKTPTEVWIGHDTRMVQRMRIENKMKVPQGGTMTQDLTLEYYDFGAAVGDVSAPPPSDTASVADLAP